MHHLSACVSIQWVQHERRHRHRARSGGSPNSFAARAGAAGHAPGSPVGLALDPEAERGYSKVTIEDIAEAADVSPRTFFNYFPSKEAALLGADPERMEGMRRRLVDEPPDKSPLEALRAVMVDEVRTPLEELACAWRGPRSTGCVG